jgi:hypothetical protein
MRGQVALELSCLPRARPGLSQPGPLGRPEIHRQQIGEGIMSYEPVSSKGVSDLSEGAILSLDHFTLLAYYLNLMTLLHPSKVIDNNGCIFLFRSEF